jgi:hypothetical protein
MSRSLQNRTVPDNAAPTLFANTMIQSALKIWQIHRSSPVVRITSILRDKSLVEPRGHAFPT